MLKLRPTGCGKCRRGQDVQEPANQKRLLLFSEHLSENMLLKLPHRQFVFTLPKLLRLYFKYERNLFQDVSRIIFSIIQDFYDELFSPYSFKRYLIPHRGIQERCDKIICYKEITRSRLRNEVSFLEALRIFGGQLFTKRSTTNIGKRT